MKSTQIADDPNAESIVPPRPNPGPEPWPVASRMSNVRGWGIVAGALLIAVVGLRWRKVRQKRRKLGQVSREIDAISGLTLSDRDRWIDSSERIRDGMVQAFGPGWRSKTTEEISNDLGLAESLPPDERLRLSTFLTVADRIKCAEGQTEPLDEWETWSVAILSRFEAVRIKSDSKTKETARRNGRR